ncbi:MAG: HAD family phosphatase [Bacteroidota bacterium]
MNIKNLIFDLGGVIVDIDPQRTVKAFTDLAGDKASELEQLFFTSDFFLDYEKGLISEKEFHAGLDQHMEKPLSFETLENAWNAMIIDIPMDRINLLRELKEKYNLLVLSNTNSIHMRYAKGVLNERGVSDFSALFDFVYYSHEVNLRKPEKAIYEHVVHHSNIQASETLFLDDDKMNLLSAEEIGINTLHITDPAIIFNHFNGAK